MELILATSDGREERVIFDDVDFEIGGQNTFQISLSYADWDGSFDFGKLVYDPYTECGGIINDIQSATNTDKIYVRGYTWRGYLDHKIITPPDGEAYKVVSGELNAVIADVIGDSFGGLFQVSQADTGVSVTNYKFNRYVSFADGLSSMLSTKGYKLQIQYIQTELSGYVEVSAVPSVNYGSDIEISQDSQLNFSNRDYRMGVNHLICLGIGELQERTVLHLYADETGAISETQTLFGLDEIVETFENTGAEADELMDTGLSRLRDLVNFKSFTAAVKNIDNIDLSLGDTITGRDYVTGNVVTEPITRKIIKRENDIVTVDYQIKGD